MVAAHPAAPLPGARGGAGCPNLLQRPRSRRSTERETLIFRAFLRGRSQPGAPLQQIRTRPRPGPPQEPHAHQHTPVRPHHRTDPGPRTIAPDEKGSFPRPDQARTFAYDPCVPRVSCVSSHLRPGGSAEPSVDEELCRGTRDRPRSRHWPRRIAQTCRFPVGRAPPTCAFDWEPARSRASAGARRRARADSRVSAGPSRADSGGVPRAEGRSGAFKCPHPTGRG